MTEPREFTSGVRRDEPIMFVLDGKEHGFRPPKRAFLVMPAYKGGGGSDYVQAQFEWLEKGLNAYDWAQLDADQRRAAHGIEDPSAPHPATSPEDWQGPQAAEIERRLRDEDDNLDTKQIEEIIDYLADVSAGRPTT